MTLESFKIYSQYIVKLKVFKYKENFFYYLSFYFLDFSF